MYIRNTPYDRINRGAAIPELKLKNSPSLFDYISDNVKRVDDRLEVKEATERQPRPTEDISPLPEDKIAEMRREKIEASLESGEPVTGISYDDLLRYYIDKRNRKTLGEIIK